MTTMIPERAARAACVLLLVGEIAAAQTDLAHMTVVAPVANMYRAPSLDADVVSQAIFSNDVVALETIGDWVKVRTSDDYLGWISAADLHAADPARPYAASGRVAGVSSLFASLYREPDIEKHRPLLTIPFESRLEIVEERQTPDGLFYASRLPDGSIAWIQRGDVTFDLRRLTIPESIALGKRFLGLPYRWGGTSSLGYDCSGFTQMLMRGRGVLMPRDSSVQAKWEGFVPVDRKNLKAGDLLFFGKTPQKINHTGMYIGNGQFIHASRWGTPVVQIGRLNDEPWTTRFVTARRPK